MFRVNPWSLQKLTLTMFRGKQCFKNKLVLNYYAIITYEISTKILRVFLRKNKCNFANYTRRL